MKPFRFGQHILVQNYVEGPAAANVYSLTTKVTQQWLVITASINQQFRKFRQLLKRSLIIDLVGDCENVRCAPRRLERSYPKRVNDVAQDITVYLLPSAIYHVRCVPFADTSCDAVSFYSRTYRVFKS